MPVNLCYNVTKVCSIVVYANIVLITYCQQYCGLPKYYILPVSISVLVGLVFSNCNLHYNINLQ